MIPKSKIYSGDTSEYGQRSVLKRIEALFLDDIGKVVTRDRIIRAARDPKTGRDPENWHRRLSESRTDHGYTILSRRDWNELGVQEYVMPTSERRPEADKRTRPSSGCWTEVLRNAAYRCEWVRNGVPCGLADGEIDPVGGGAVKPTPDHLNPHSLNPDADPDVPSRWEALCGRHQVMKKNYWDGMTGKLNIMGMLQSVGKKQKREALEFLPSHFGLERIRRTMNRREK